MVFVAILRRICWSILDDSALALFIDKLHDVKLYTRVILYDLRVKTIATEKHHTSIKK